WTTDPSLSSSKTLKHNRVLMRETQSDGRLRPEELNNMKRTWLTVSLLALSLGVATAQTPRSNQPPNQQTVPSSSGSVNNTAQQRNNTSPSSSTTTTPASTTDQRSATSSSTTTTAPSTDTT